MNRLGVFAAAAAAIVFSLSQPTAALANHEGCAALHSLDPDGDGTLDWHEARRAAVHLFHTLDPDHDGTLDLTELRGRVGLVSFMLANPDRDRTLDKDEFLTIVKHRFERANPDADGTIDCRELHSLRGQRLLRVLQ